MATCSLPECSSGVFGRGMCSKHYTRWLRHGDPLTTTRTPPRDPAAPDKFCPRCQTTKPVGDFGLRPSGKPKGYCVPCERDYDANYAKTDVGREARRIASLRWEKANHEYFLKYRYGITKADYERMREAQGDSCAICGDAEPGGNHTLWPVDHCHTTDKVRGLLCNRCNMGLGYFKDDADRLRRAVSYIENGGVAAPE